MSFRMHVYWPNHFSFKHVPCILYGCYKKFDDHVVINCILSLPYEFNLDGDNVPSKKLVKADDLECYFGKIGFVYPSHDIRCSEVPSHVDDDVSVGVRINRNDKEIIVDHLAFEGNPVSSENVYLIFYNTNDIRYSELLELELKQGGIFEHSFVHFLIETITFCSEKDNFLKHKILPEKLLVSSNLLCTTKAKQKPRFLLDVGSCMFLMIWCLVFPVGWLCNNTPEWCSHFLKELLLKTAVGRQLCHRWLQIYYIFNQVQKRNAFDICSKNVLVAIILDVALGWMVAHYIQSNIPLHVLLHSCLNITNDLVNWLQKLILWLMGVPAGLKLNIPLNSALGHIFLYHIYLWKTYIMIVLPIFKAALVSLPFVGAFGFTFLLSLLSDIIAFITIHIYCFYGYASRLYYYQLCCLVTLWRLFRGKKWNPESQRVESYTYGVHQLYVGTLLFTVLLFLLPTVMVYYFVFTVLRLMVLFVQGVLSHLINVMATLPVYGVVMRICNSVQTTGAIHLSVLQSSSVLVFQMKVVQIAMLSVVKHSLPAIDICSREKLSWRSFVSSLLWGKIIYPI